MITKDSKEPIYKIGGLHYDKDFAEFTLEYALMFQKLLFLCHITQTILRHIKGHSVKKEPNQR